MSRLSTEPPVPHRTGGARSRRAAIAGAAGTLIEYYDYSVYAFLAVTIAPLFFPSDRPAISVLVSLAVFGSANVVRPLGGWFFGRLGDRHGRRRALVITVVAMGGFSGMLGVLPTYATAGILAPVLVVLVRLAQGFFAGGEIGGAATYVSESVTSKRRGLFGSLIPAGSTLGWAVAAAVAGAVSALTSTEQLAAWGWRIPFLMAIPLAILSLWLRLRLDETAEFTAMREKSEVVRDPLLRVAREHPGPVLRIFGLTVATNGAGYIGLAYFSVYLINERGFPREGVYWTSALAIALSCAIYPLVGLLTDRIGRRPVLLVAYVLLAAIAWPSLAILGATSSLLLVGVVYVVFMSVVGAVGASVFPMYPELFPRRVRYTGVALGFNLGTIVAGGSAPYIAAQLVQSTGDPMSPAYWVIGVSAIGLLTVLTLRKTAQEPTADPTQPERGQHDRVQGRAD